MAKNLRFDEINRQNTLNLLSDLVNIPSYDNEQGIVDYISRRMDKLGIKYEITEVIPDRANLTAFIGSGDKSLIFNSHMDTVPPGKPEDWHYPALELTIENKNIYGLGCCDAKGSLASMMMAFEALSNIQNKLNGRLILQAVCCEETKGRGTQKEVKRGITADAAIVGEPTDMIPMIGHKGGLGVEVKVSGKAAHASAPEEGINAIYRSVDLVNRLRNLADEIMNRRDPLFGHASLAVTQIKAGQAPNVIPDECIINLDRRLLPGESVDTAFQEIINTLEADKPTSGVSVNRTIGIEPCRISSNEAIVKAVKQGMASITGSEPEISGFTACCDMWSLVRGADIPTVILGPGKTSMAHKPDETIELDAVCQAAHVYREIALNWFGSQK
ncbi:ArgE/DapE family deacylase [Candidatus Poribacteria bacterium]|nr:ArgE/DapE family deacylase [Candidatus Poribacteria bacterium]